MSRYINILIIVNCIVAIQGVFLSFILGTKKKNRKANHILAVMVFLFSLGMMGPVYIITGVYIEFWWLAPFFNSLPYSFGPLIYFYIKALTEPGIRYSRLQLLHALPVVLAAIYYSAVFFLPAVAREAFLYRIYFDKSLAASLSMYISMTQALIYVLLCFRLFKAHSQKIKKTYSDLEKINLAWIRHLVVLFIAIWVVAAGLQSFLPEELISAKLDDAITYFLLSLFIFTIGYRGMSQPEIFDLQPQAPQDPQEPPRQEEMQEQQEQPPQASSVKAKKYEKTGLSPEQSVTVSESLLALMKESRLYLNPSLTLPQVAAEMNLPVHQLSQVINDNMDRNFYRFINGYRIKEAMQRLENPQTTGDKLIKIAFDSGFNSLSTFNRVFKDFNGQSPSQFRQKKQKER